MPIIQSLTKRIDDYFAQNRATDSYDEIDAAFEIVGALSDDELMKAIHEAGLWPEILGEKVAGITRDSWAQTVRDIVVHVIVSAVLQE